MFGLVSGKESGVLATMRAMALPMQKSSASCVLASIVADKGIKAARPSPHLRGVSLSCTRHVLGSERRLISFM